MVADGLVSAGKCGSGPGLWLFHSLLADRGSFAKVIEPLAKGFTVYVPELPGFGASRGVEGGLAAVADRMEQAIRSVYEEQPIVLGNGYGGFVALQMAIRHAGLVSKLVLADCGARFSNEGRQAFLNMANAAKAGGVEAICDVAMRRLFAPAFQAENPALVAERRVAFLAVDKAVVIAACHTLATMDLTPDLDRVRCPTLVLVGQEDEATPPFMSEQLAAGLKNAQLHVLPGCAHVPQLQDPIRFLERVRSFLM
ncbi:MAG: alpha/beta fold hydrolase [Methylobacteriaceae bacterium]|nr:alpha/beta fold hydrolase [Methylobacteriaceae bacterium]